MMALFDTSPTLPDAGIASPAEDNEVGSPLEIEIGGSVCVCGHLCVGQPNPAETIKIRMKSGRSLSASTL